MRHVIVTKNEILASPDAPDSYRVGRRSDGLRISLSMFSAFRARVGFADAAVVFNLDDVLSLRAKAA